MPRRKTKFIDKKNAVTFHLVHRSQQDPMLVSEDASHFVLLPSGRNKKEQQLEEQRKYGVYFEDDYNYLQHLKEANETLEIDDTETFQMISSEPYKTAPDVKLHLPSTVFSSGVETKVGLLNKAAPQSGPKVDWDPDIVAALDEDYNFEDPECVLDDDFMMMANKKDSEDEDSSDEDDSDESGSDISSNLGDISGSDAHSDDDYFMEEETKSHFTNYSMTSSVVPRSEALKDIDDQFEKFFEQYEDTEIGALDMDDIEGNMDVKSEVMSKMIAKYQESKMPQNLDEVLKNTSLDVNNLNLSSESEGEIEVEEKTEKWDCESILSTYSNLYNHPKLILEPKKERKIKLNKMGIPEEVFYTRGIKLKDLEDDTTASVMSVSTVRNKNESKEDKRERKTTIKAQRKERRIEKKLNQQAFKEAKRKREAEVIAMQKNMKSVSIA
ncbi:protein LTV1 homolog [Octopus bimaculoides]|uniref:Protein LTV1 homolog n=1 Tax=Octopus bimaculoides TaxID=37653 RepID=A0A0L8HZJ5_OCTBM|nr:protein LTV1 homolog [Octopus bimaculoides]|eukprot:XP_014768373.1 PREDICTED: protein LTV1 homolog [Octopus bimaculoides]